MAAQATDATILSMFRNLPDMHAKILGDPWHCSSCQHFNGSNFVFCVRCSNIRKSFRCLTCKQDRQIDAAECSECRRRNPFLKYGFPFVSRKMEEAVDNAQSIPQTLCNACFCPIGSAEGCQNCHWSSIVDVDLDKQYTQQQIVAVTAEAVFINDVENALVKTADIEKLGAFTDENFSRVTTGLTSDPDWTIVWLHPTEMNVGGPLNLMDDVLPFEVQQGSLGDCWLIAAMSLLGSIPEMLKRIFITKAVNANHLYVLRMCVDGQWQTVFIDDLLPCNKNVGRPLFTQIHRGKLFPALIEKGLAKIHGGFASLKGGSGVEALGILTGAPIQTIFLNATYGDHFRQQQLWEDIQSWQANGYILTARCGSKFYKTMAEYTAKLLKAPHAYSILEVIQLDDRRLLRLYNPTGDETWNGAYSDNWDGWSPADKVAADATHAAKGIFLISIGDLVEMFDEIYVCKWNKDHYEVRHSGQLMPYSEVHAPLLNVAETSEFHLFLQFQDFRKLATMNPRTPHGLLDMLLLVLKIDDSGSGKFVDLVATSDRNHNSAFVSLTLTKGSYAILPLSFNHWEKSLTAEQIPKYALSIFSENAFVLDVPSSPIAPKQLASAIAMLIEKNGKKYETEFGCYYELKHADCIGSMILAENATPHDLICKCRLLPEPEKPEDKAKMAMKVRVCINTTRRRQSTVDVLAPYSRMIINVFTVDDPTYGIKYEPWVTISKLADEREREAVREATMPFPLGINNAALSAPSHYRNSPFVNKFNCNLHCSLPLAPSDEAQLMMEMFTAFGAL